jgi:hypothetical protein
MNKKEILYLIGACVFLFAFRLLYIGVMPHGDEGIWIDSAVHQEYYNYMVPHPPLSVWIYNIFYLLTYFSRIVPILFNIATFLFSYLLLKEYTSEEKPMNWYIVLFCLSFWNYLAAVQIDIDGGILTALITASLFFFVKYEKTEKKAYYIISAIVFGLALLAKFTGLFIPMILGLYLIIKTKSIWKPVKTMFPFALIGGAIFSIFPIFYSNAPRFSWIFTHGAGLNWYPTPLSLVYLLIWGTPLIAIFLILSYKIITKENMLLLIWALVPIVVYLFGRPFAAPFDRYLMVIIPPALMIGALLVNKYLESRITYLVALIFALFVIPLNIQYVSHSFSNYISSIIHLHWDFFFPVTGPSGPLFGIPMIILIPLLITSFASLLFMIKYPKQCFAVILSLGLAFNLFMILIMTTSYNQPNINGIKLDMLNDIDSITDGYTNEKSFILFNPNLKNIKDYNPIGLVFILDYPPKFILDPKLDNCSLVKEYSDRGQTFGYQYWC